MSEPSLHKPNDILNHSKNNEFNDSLHKLSYKDKLELLSLFSDTKPRNDYISWEQYFMSIACLSSYRSKDPCTQVGACIVNDQNKIVAVGYNGMPQGISDETCPWGKGCTEEPLNNKYLYVCHAELNAVLNSNISSLKDCILYSTLFPCNECAKVIIQSGIKEVIYYTDDKKGTTSNEASKLMFNRAKIKYSILNNNWNLIKVMNYQNKFMNPYDNESLYECGSNEESTTKPPLINQISSLTRFFKGKAYEKTSSDADFSIDPSSSIDLNKLVRKCHQAVEINNRIGRILCANIDQNMYLYLSIEDLPFIFRVYLLNDDLPILVLEVTDEIHGKLVPIKFIIDSSGQDLVLIGSSLSKPGRILTRFQINDSKLEMICVSQFHDYDRYLDLALNYDSSLLLIIKKSDVNVTPEIQIIHLSKDFTKKNFAFSIEIPEEFGSRVVMKPLCVTKMNKNKFWILMNRVTENRNELVKVEKGENSEYCCSSLEFINFNPVEICPYDSETFLLIPENRDALYYLNSDKTTGIIYKCSNNEKILFAKSSHETFRNVDSYSKFQLFAMIFTQKKIIKFNL